MKYVMLFLLLFTLAVFGAGFDMSIVPDSATGSYNHDFFCDSVRSIYENPEGTPIDTIMLYPNPNDSSITRDTTDAGMSGLVAAAYYVRYEIYEAGDNALGTYGDGNHLREPEWFESNTLKGWLNQMAAHGGKFIDADSVKQLFFRATPTSHTDSIKVIKYVGGTPDTVGRITYLENASGKVDTTMYYYDDR